MKMVTAIIQPSKINDVRESLFKIGVHGITVTKIRGLGREKRRTELYRGTEYFVELLPKIKIEIVVQESMLELTIKSICDSANTDTVGDGKIFVSNLEQVIRIRTGESGRNAV